MKKILFNNEKGELFPCGVACKLRKSYTQTAKKPKTHFTAPSAFEFLKY